MYADISIEPLFDIAVRLEPNYEPPFEAKMRAGISKTFLLQTGIRVHVKYDPDHNHEVTLDNEVQTILACNRQLVKMGQ